MARAPRPPQDGRWEVRWHVREGGKLVRRSLYAKTEEEAGRKLRDELRKGDIGMPSPHGPLTVGGNLTRRLEDVTPSIRPGSVRRYTQLVEQHLVPALGDVRLVRLQPDHLQSFYAAKLRGTLARDRPPGPCRLHRALSRALRSGKVSRNVADAAMVDLPRLPKRDAAFLDPEQTARALAHAGDGDDRLEVLWITALTGRNAPGRALGAALGRRRPRPRHDRRPLHAAARPPAGGAQVRLVAARGARRRLRRRGSAAPPGTAGRRAVPGGQPVARAAPRGRGQKGKALSGGPSVPQPLRRAAAPMVLGRGWNRLLDRSGLPRMPFHSARHTAASLMAEAHTHPKVAAERLGHAKAGMTLDRYTHSSDDRQREAASATERFLGLSS